MIRVGMNVRGEIRDKVLGLTGKIVGYLQRFLKKIGTNHIFVSDDASSLGASVSTCAH